MWDTEHTACTVSNAQHMQKDLLSSTVLHDRHSCRNLLDCSDSAMLLVADIAGLELLMCELRKQG